MENQVNVKSGQRSASTFLILWMLLGASLVGLLIYSPEAAADGLDYLIIRDAPNGGGNPVGDRNYDLGDNDTFYCAGYNYTSGYIGDVDANWYSTNSNVGQVNPTSNSNSTQFQTLSGGVVQVHVYVSGGPYNTTGNLAVYTPVDYILVRDAPDGGGNWVGDREYYAPDVETYYAAGYNNTNGYLGDIDVNWFSTNTSVGNVNASYGKSVTFFASGAGYTYVKAYTYNGPTQIYNYTGKLNVTLLPLDYVVIRDSPGGGGNVIIDMNYTLGESDFFYCAGYNYTTGYLRDFKAYWVSHNQDVGEVYPYLFSNWTVFQTYAGGVAVVHAYVLGGRYNTTGNLTVASPIDYIIIRDAPDGGGQAVGNRSYFVGDSETFYAAGYNYTTGYWGDVRVHWYSTNTEAGNVNPTSKSNSTEFQTLAGGTTQVHLYVVDGPYNATGNLVVYTPVDFIIIRDAPDGGGNWVGDREYFVSDNETFYAAGYNNTNGYLGDIKVHWYMTNTSVGSLSSFNNNWTTFTAKKAGYTFVQAYTYNGPAFIGNYTGKLNVTVAPIDYIIIRNYQSGEGEWVGDTTYWKFDSDTYYAAGYNNTHHYQGDFSVNWSSNDTSVGTVSPQGDGTLFSAVGEGTCQVSAQYYGLTNTTGTLTVLSVITVDDSGGADFYTIQEAIDAASPGDRIYVFNGTYNEHVIVNKTVHIKGENKYETKIDGNATGTVVLITADNVTLERFTVQRGAYGLFIDDANGTVILNNLIDNYTYGIYNNLTNDSLIKYNVISNGEYGVVTYEAFNDAVRYNLIKNNTEYGAKDYNSQLKNCFNWNTFQNNKVAYWYDPTVPLTELEFDGNILENNEIGVKVSDASTVRITNNTIRGGDFGIYVINGSPFIYSNIIEDCRVGIYLSNSSSKVENNTITGPEYGIISIDSSPTIIENTVQGSSEDSILVESAAQVEILSNTVPDMIILNSTVVNLTLVDTDSTLVNSMTENLDLQGTSTLTVKWLVDIMVKDSLGNAVGSAPIIILDMSGTEVATLLSGADGHTETMALTEYVLDSQGQTFSTPHTFTTEKNGLKAKDTLYIDGNKDVTLVIPEPLLTTVLYDGAWKNTDFTITLQTTGGDGGINFIYYRINSGPTLSVQANGQPVIATEGDNNILEFWAEDNTGNIEPHRFIDAIKLDKTTPFVTIITESGMTATDDFKVEAEVRDTYLDDSKVLIQVDGNPPQPMNRESGDVFAATFDTLLLAGGEHTLRVLAYDLAGNLNYDKTITFTIQSPNPLVTTHVYDGTWRSGDFEIELQATGGVGGIKSIYYRINSGLTLTVSADGNPHITEEGDNNLLEFWAEDNYGNQEMHRFLYGIKLDKTRPQVKILTEGGKRVTGDLLIEARVTDSYIDNANIMIQVDHNTPMLMKRGSGEVFIVTIDTSIIDPGEHTVRILASDLAGNQNDTEIMKFESASVPVSSKGFPWLLLVIIVGSAMVIAVGGLLVTEVGKFALISLFVPLYMKIKEDSMMDNYTRGKIYQYVELNPGDHYNSIKKALDLNNGSLTYHLTVLEKGNLIKSRHDGIYKRFYPYETKVPETNGGTLTEVQKRVVDAIKDLPGVTQKELASVLGLRQSTLSYQLSRLEEKGMISSVRDGKKTFYHSKY